MPPKFARKIDDLPSTEDVLSRTGLEFMQAIRDGELAAPPIGQHLGFRVVEAEHGRVVFEGIPPFDALNPTRGVHGGWYGAILDSCMACAVMTELGKGQFYTTLEYKINITRALPVGMTVRAEGRTQHVGHSTGVAIGEVRGAEDGRLYATGSTTCMVMTQG